MGGQTEPAADLRQMASGLWQMFIALTNEGFSERQALTIIGYAISGAQQNGDQS